MLMEDFYRMARIARAYNAGMPTMRKPAGDLSDGIALLKNRSRYAAAWDVSRFDSMVALDITFGGIRFDHLDRWFSLCGLS